jgi:predicted transcriptional regulator of viral defense system
MKHNEAKLFEIAEAQQGYFSTKQALKAGYASRTHLYHVSTGAWIREHRGIFRLARFPTSSEGQYVLWSLWSRDRADKPQGAYSHQTALSIYELSDVMPVKLHMTVPRNFRRNSAVPEVLTLHKADTAKSDVEQRQGYSVVHPLRAIADLLAEGAESRDRLRQALAEGLQRGLITRAELQRHPNRIALNALLKGKRA